MRLKSLLSCALLFVLSSCDKDFDNPKGDYLMCKMNGEVWQSNELSYGPIGPGRVNYDPNWLQIRGKNNGRYIDISIRDTLNTIVSGTYALQNTCGGHFFNADFHYENALSVNSCDDQSVIGQLELVVETDKKRVSGTFHFKTTVDSSGTTMDITEGKFSLPY